ncbi:DNA recombination protein RmuC [uncultured Helicobacter sp.]|uniref:DNA recombination protein RmuC n=1 Tax=uncultured Helicobacter sp. TaxID=175537 RepID=UPI00375215FC
MQVIYICAGLLLVCVIVLCAVLVRSKFQNATLRKDLQTLLTHNQTLIHNEQILQTKIRESSEQYTKLLQENARLQAYMDSNATLLQTLEQTYAQNLATLKSEFAQSLQIQSQGMLQQNKLYLMEDSKKILESVFAPVRESMREYKEHLIANETKLEMNIKNMFAYTQDIGQNADKLAQILKGDKKIRGNFAEIQLKNVLEHSGLIEGEQYKLQEHFSLEGSGYRPDAVVYLDKQKSIIIDSKFPLPNDFSFQSVDVNVCQEIARNLKNRIDELAKKPYANFQSHTYEFVLLFIPYQNILDLALSVDNGIYQYAYTKKVYLTTPHTLFMALKTIEVSWVHIQSDEKVRSAFEEIGKFYDKFVGITEDFMNLKKLIERLGKQSDEIDSKLISGRGSLASRFESLKKLGAKTTKVLPTKDFADV